MNDLSLASFGHHTALQPTRRSWTRQTTVWGLVALVHLLLVTLFVMSEFAPEDRLHPGTPIETIFLLSMLPSMNAPEVKIIKPEVPSATAPIITISPPKVQPLQPEPPMIKPETPADILKSIGEALACSANSYEELTPEARSHCVHEPWLPRQAADGTIVLEAPPRQATQQPALHLTGAEQMRRDMETGPHCPILQNTPCLSEMGQSRN